MILIIKKKIEKIEKIEKNYLIFIFYNIIDLLPAGS